MPGTSDPTVSVVVPAFNAADTVAETVDSALNQTVRDIEVIVVDDGSSDSTVRVVEGINDDRLQLVSQPNGGAAAARNTGILASRGEYVAFLDADDVWLPYKLEEQLAVFRRDGSVSAVQSGAYFVDPELRVLSERPCRPSVDALLDTLRFQNQPAYLSTLIVERRMFDVMGHFDTVLEILEEWDMAIKVARHCNLFSIREPLTLYRVHSGNRSRNLDIHIRPGLLVLERLFADPTLPAHIRSRKQEIYGRFYTMLAGGALKTHQWRVCSRWALKALATDPMTLAYMAKLPARRLSRRLSRRAHSEQPLALLANNTS